MKAPGKPAGHTRSAYEHFSDDCVPDIGMLLYANAALRRSGLLQLRSGNSFSDQ